MKVFYACIVIVFQQLSSVALLDISPCAIWERNATTVLGTGVAGDGPNQLSDPVGLFIFYPTNDLYIADHKNARIQKISLNSTTGIATTAISNIFFPLHIYVDDDMNDPTIYVTLSIDSRVEKWVKGAQKGEPIVTGCNDCVGVALDQEKNVYVTDTLSQRIIKWSSQTQTISVVAGNESKAGSDPELLSIPQGLFVTEKGDALYIADSGNSRIQKWLKGASNGVTVAGLGNGTSSNDSFSLDNPVNVIVDETTQIVYVADTYNNRIMRWLPEAKQGDIIAGLGGRGTNPDQLNQAADLKFDQEGNLYVADMQNHRVQRFQLLDNQACSSASLAAGQYSTEKIISLLILICLMILFI